MIPTPVKDASAIDIEASRRNGQGVRLRRAPKRVSFVSPVQPMPTSEATLSRYDSVKDRILAIFYSLPIKVVMTVVYTYVLFIEDIRILAFKKSSDVIFEVLSSIAFFLFLVDIAIKCIGLKGYVELPTRRKLETLQEELPNERRILEKVKLINDAIFIGSFYFWVDMIGTLSMIFEVRMFSCLHVTSAKQWNIARVLNTARLLVFVCRPFCYVLRDLHPTKATVDDSILCTC